MYWRGAEAWASARLEPNQLLEVLRQQGRYASQERLIQYFFGKTWRNVPEEARKHLIDAESSWFDDRGGAIGSVLNDLRLAAEKMCYAFIWESLQKSEGKLYLLEFKNRDSNLSKGYDPSLTTYARLCRQQFFREFVWSTELSLKQKEFLTKRNCLSSALYSLRESRNIADHDPKIRMTRDKVRPLVDLFLGIGQPGVLRRLAEIGPNLADK